jgi:hypothetical protein
MAGLLNFRKEQCGNKDSEHWAIQTNRLMLYGRTEAEG